MKENEVGGACRMYGEGKCINVWMENLRERDNLEDIDIVESNVPFNFFTAARTCCCFEQKTFTRPDDCAALQKFFCNINHKDIYNEN
jgi:hypothetical protein